MKKLFIVFALSIMLLGLVSAVAPVTSIQAFPTGLTIVNSPQIYIKQNTDFEVNFIVHNSTTGYHIDNSSVNCTFFLENSQGTLIAVENVSYNDLGYWNLTLLSGNFSDIGQHNYAIDCHDGVSGGETTGTFFVNSIGKKLHDSEAYLTLGCIAIIMLFMGMLIFIIDRLPNNNSTDEEGNIMSVSYLKYLGSILWFVEWILVISVLFIVSNLATAFLPAGIVASVFFVLFQICFALTPLIVILWMIMIIRSIYYDKSVQNLLNRGMFPGSEM